MKRFQCNKTIYLRNYNKRSNLSIVRCYYFHWNELIDSSLFEANAMRYIFVLFLSRICNARSLSNHKCSAFLAIWFISLFQQMNVLYHSYMKSVRCKTKDCKTLTRNKCIANAHSKVQKTEQQSKKQETNRIQKRHGEKERRKGNEIQEVEFL